MTEKAILTELTATLDRIEAEMKRIGFWSDDPPNVLERTDRGDVRSYLDAPSFELWLQGVFLPRARGAVADDTLPDTSQVGLMAQRQYDYHSFVPEAQDLLQLLNDFDRLVEGRRRG